MGFKIRICLGEMFAPKPAIVGAEGRRMGRFEDEVLRRIDHGGFLLGKSSPEEKDQIFALGVELVDRGVGEFFPAFIAVGGGLVGPDGQDGIEKKHPLVGPVLQIAVAGDRHAQVILDFFVHVAQRRRGYDALLHRKAQAVGLSRTVVRILSDDHHLDVVERGGVKGIENVLAGRVNGLASFLFGDQKCFQHRKVGLVEFVREGCLPAFLDAGRYVFCCHFGEYW